MDLETIKYEITGHIGLIRIMDKGKDQGGMERLVHELSDTASAAAAERDVRVVVLADVEKLSSWTAGQGAGGQLAEDIPPLSLTEPVAGIEKPVIAGINGDAIGCGLELLLSCDLRIGAEGSRFGLNQLEKGVIPQQGGTQRLARLIGKGRALEMVLTGSVLDASEAFRIGLINRVVPGPDLHKSVMDTARDMASKSPISLNYAKETINAGMDMTLAQGLRLEADLYMLMHTSRDRKEGIRAFQEKRTPEFRGE